MEEKVLETIKKYNLIESGDKIVLGVSGGPDSISMLVILNKLKEKLNFDIVVAHVNHGLRENAKIDEEYVKNFCKKLGVEFYCLHCDVNKISKEKKLTLEEAGRFVRYDYFNEVLEKEGANKIAVAHNKNDKAETIIMNILRGSGINGLIGIDAKSGIYIRPLIEITRNEIEEFSKEFNPRHDESNDVNDCTRNKVRNIVIPYIQEEFNSNIIQGLNNLSENVKEVDEYLSKETKKAYEKVSIQEINLEKENEKKEIILDLKEFNKFDKVIQKEILLYSINKILGTVEGIGKVHLDDMVKLCNNNIGNKYLVPKKNLKIEIKNKKIYLNNENSISVGA